VLRSAIFSLFRHGEQLKEIGVAKVFEAENYPLTGFLRWSTGDYCFVQRKREGGGYCASNVTTLTIEDGEEFGTKI